MRTIVARHNPTPPLLVLDAPLSSGHQVLVANGEPLKLQWFSPEGMHVLAATFGAVGDEDRSVWHVEVGDELEIVNRRRFARVRKRGTALVKAGMSDFAMNVLDVCEGGVRCRVPMGVDAVPSPEGPGDVGFEEVAPETVIEPATVVTTELHLGEDGTLAVRGFVAWVGHGSSWLEFGVAFEDLDTDDQEAEALRRHVLAILREHRRQELDT